MGWPGTAGPSLLRAQFLPSVQGAGPIRPSLPPEAEARFGQIPLTGAGGNLASGLVERLEGRYDLRLSDVAPVSTPHQFVAADVRRRDELAKAAEGVHSAHRPPVSDATIFAVNVGGTFNVLEAAREAGIRAVVFASSMAYGWGSVYSVMKVPTRAHLEERGERPLREASGLNPRHLSPPPAQAAVPYKRFLRRLEDEHRDTVEDARRSLAAVHSPEKAEKGPFVAVGYANLVAAAKRLCGEASHHLLVANCAPEAAVLDPALQAAAARGVAIGTLCRQACPAPCGHCMGSLVRADVSPSGSVARWLFCVRDDEELLVGEVPAAGDARATLTYQRPFLAAGVGLLCYAATMAERGRTAEPLPDSARFQAWLETR